jgi:hypothetical protein
MFDASLALDRVCQFLTLRYGRANIKQKLGYGTDGTVWATENDTAVKVFHHERGYFNERDTYLRLRDWGIGNKLGRFWIPTMIAHDDALCIVEMDMMQATPYIIDFAKVRLDRPPDFSEQTLRDSERRGRDLFDENWPAVKMLLADLESFQIYYVDPTPYNIVFDAP